MSVISPLLAARNIKETIEFYKTSLGFKMGMAFPDANNPEYVDLSKDGMVLMFIPAENHGIGAEEKLGVGVYLYMQIDGDIDEYYDELKKKFMGVTPEGEDGDGDGDGDNEDRPKRKRKRRRKEEPEEDDGDA